MLFSSSLFQLFISKIFEQSIFSFCFSSFAQYENIHFGFFFFHQKMFKCVWWFFFDLKSWIWLLVLSVVDSNSISSLLFAFWMISICIICNERAWPVPLFIAQLSLAWSAYLSSSLFLGRTAGIDPNAVNFLWENFWLFFSVFISLPLAFLFFPIFGLLQSFEHFAWTIVHQKRSSAVEKRNEGEEKRKKTEKTKEKSFVHMKIEKICDHTHVKHKGR